MKTAVRTLPATPTEREIRDQIERIASSAAFRPSDRLKHFITFVASQALAGKGDNLKEYAVGVQVFGRESSFDPRTDPVVRVQARRLRARLERYYKEEGQNDQILVDMPKGGYAPVFHRRDVDAVGLAQAPAALQRNTIAVQPFADLTPQQHLGLPCAGLTREVIRRLTQVRGIRVAAAQLPQGASAAMHLEGSIHQAAEGYRLTFTLVNVTNGCYECCESLDIVSVDSFAVQDSIADKVVERLQRHLTAASTPQRPQTENLAARNLCKQGHYHLEQRTDESLERAAEFFERAVIEDAQYSLAHSGLSDAYSMLGSYGLRPSTSMVTMALSSAATAVMLDDQSAQARTSLAHAKARAHWNWLEAELEFQRAIRLDPTYATGHHWYARCCLVPLGRLDEARDEVLLAQSLDPVSSIIAREVASIHYYRRDYEVALAYCDQAIELNPHFPHAYFILSLVQEKLGDFDEALAALLRGAQLAPKSPRMIASLGRAQAMAGRRDEALRSLAEISELERTRFVSTWERAIVHLAMKDYDKCFEQLFLALQDRFFDLSLLAVDPRFDDVRDDPRFETLVHKAGMR
ncbi:MAG TPA: tetratricopeptide repeat protein [Vicinamibacterales bacterium]|nr:tetratricopeptide repeat protein [Vicinamibacterales bacterium]